MLEVHLPEREFFDEERSEFIVVKPVTLKLEHSLLSISRWESKIHKRFLDKKDKTNSELLFYIKCMTINRDVPDEAYIDIPNDVIEKINEYIADPMTATTFSNHQTHPGRKSSEAVSSELVYFWMAQFNIPFECEKWPFNRLMTLINICSIKNQPPKKMSKRSIGKQQANLNAMRRRAMNSSG